MAGSSEQNGVASDLVGQAADRTHGVADWLDGRQPEDLLDELRRLARRRPGAFLIGALAAGVVAGRLTRGAVAAHSDDSSGASTGAGVRIAGFADRSPRRAGTALAYGREPSVGAAGGGAVGGPVTGGPVGGPVTGGPAGAPVVGGPAVGGAPNFPNGGNPA